MRITVDEDKCVGAGQCAMAAPDVFDQRDDDGIVVVLDADPEESLRPQIANSIALCPARAIEFAESPR